MNDLLDEVTVPLKTHVDTDSVSSSGGVRLTSLNAIKNQARYTLAQRQTELFDNDILRVSAELLSLIISVKRLECPADMYTFRMGLKGQLTDLKYKVAKLDYPPSVADKTCFLFAVMLDEQILHSEWGEESGWENQTLVSELFGVKNGGEQFYLVAERALLQPILLKDLLELIYIMIKLGFRGRYRVEGKELLGVLVQRLEEAVFADVDQGSEPERMPIPRPIASTFKRRARPQRPVRLGRGAMLFVALLASFWGGIYYWYQITVPVKAEPFTSLPSFTDKYYSQANAQEKEYIYTSTDQDLSGAKKSYVPASSNVSSIATSGSTSSSVSARNGFRVQLATLSSKSSAQNFLSQHGEMLPNAQVERQGNFYIVSSNVATTQEAQEVLSAAKNAGIDDAFVIRAKQ
ncbi:type IVB secretion system protein IcmH/DotU [Vibrio sp. SCSIO 43140]|uniref:type IVB secretion system protein IcmH/DotU n=1 Tax=Vibrio sp. SCSIO 43140 TaxID=2819100 RepID=UPI0020762B2B|nr:type IVB secretion system protein IcmH/DotU [Vibrio sp. SCSIO 43140]USD62285.1 type IVB secretion system protein IcmH/DotU [Vibrio sp. SCSIO 43140]